RAWGPTPSGLRLSGDGSRDGIGPRANCVIEMVLFERGANLTLDDILRLKIGKLSFHALASLDADPTLGDRYDEKDPVVLVLLSDLPGVERAVGHVFDRLALERRRDEDRDLRPARAIHGFQALLEVVSFARGELAGAGGE